MAGKSDAAVIARLAGMWRTKVRDGRHIGYGAKSPLQAAIAYHVHAAGGRMTVHEAGAAVGRPAAKVKERVWGSHRLIFIEPGVVGLTPQSAADVESAMRDE